MQHKLKTTYPPTLTSNPIPTMFFNSHPPYSSSPPCSHSPQPFTSRSRSPPSATPPPPPVVVVSPCAACKILRRRCIEKCVLAPYFPPNDPIKFIIAHRVFGASNIIKFLQELRECEREDAVSSMVYEANARIRDPIYGCAGAICQLQNQVNELQAQLAKAQAEIINMHFQHTNLVALICMEMSESQGKQFLQSQKHFDMSSFLDENSLGCSWEPLWT
ncbi:hypothetical protein Lal_00028484 [Lupinus albus]|uniref:Putative transcription factor AS2-LOB family n=1 Tax=Lupinus albus TaxID=3870 RepID=A0A6A4NYM3_LUPAL|nr:putative transcription factor AS2-LOB family [Lupinus albus]KAF1884603.1 hypothetical protein Lal_00028484 [Lupinus albus]